MGTRARSTPFFADGRFLKRAVAMELEPDNDDTVMTE